MRLEFSNKIMGSFLGMAILSVLVGYFAFVMTKNVQRVSRAIMKENVSSLKAAEELELALLSQKGLVSSYFLDTDSAWLKTLEEKKQDFDMWFDKAKEVAITKEEKNILHELIGLYNTYDAQRNKAIRLYQTGNTADAKRILLTDMKNSIDALYGKCEDLILANEALIAKAETFSQKNAFMMTNLIWITIAVTLCFGALTGFFIARRINEQLIRSAKMASLGQLSASVAHEIKNPLTSIKMRLYSLGEGLKNVSAVQEDIGIISEEIHRMEKTVKNFLDFARPPEPRFEKCDLQGIIEGAV